MGIELHLGSNGDQIGGQVAPNGPFWSHFEGVGVGLGALAAQSRAQVLYRETGNRASGCFNPPVAQEGWWELKFE